MTSNPVAGAIRDVFISPNVADANFESADIVDVVAKVARATHRVSKALADDNANVTTGLYAIAKAIDGLTTALRVVSK